MVWILATLKIREGMNEEFEAVFGALVDQVRANEPGCLQYTLTRKQGAPDEYVVVEHYADDAAREAHGKSDHFRAAGPKLGPCLAGRPELIVLDLVK